MTRIKKTRTEKSIGAAKKPLEKQSERKAPLVRKKGKGRPAGAKANIDGASKKTKHQGKSKGEALDLRVGSKKAISLVVAPTKQPMSPKVKVVKTKITPPVEKSVTPEQELENIEADDRLNGLLDQLDNDEVIANIDQQYVDQQTDRYQQLMVELGLDDEEEEQEEQAPEKDIWDRFDNSKLDDYQD